MKLNTIARIVAAVILSLGVLTATAGAAAACTPDKTFLPPWSAEA